MPKYYFHIKSDAEYVEDTEGVELESDKVALEEARDAAREILAERVRRGDVIDGHEFDVRDAAGAELFKFPFRDVLRLH